MPTRRRETVKKNVRLTAKGIEDIQAWADQNGLSFSAALETLANLGLGKDVNNAMLPAVLSLTKSVIRSEYDRLIRLVLYGIVESGFSARMASASLRTQVGDLQTFEKIKNFARADARKNLTRGKIGELFNQLMGDNKGDKDEQG